MMTYRLRFPRKSLPRVCRTRCVTRSNAPDAPCLERRTPRLAPRNARRTLVNPAPSSPRPPTRIASPKGTFPRETPPIDPPSTTARAFVFAPSPKLLEGRTRLVPSTIAFSPCSSNDYTPRSSCRNTHLSTFRITHRRATPSSRARRSDPASPRPRPDETSSPARDARSRSAPNTPPSSPSSCSPPYKSDPGTLATARECLARLSASWPPSSRTLARSARASAPAGPTPPSGVPALAPPA
mmetsp:Transcript_4370/g.16669  ORF Transcript_4370/g.16669 Transcript_4370/m.16669 type:complete len:240 (-) Transcript_4370:67-786(-)